jgi:hypothetical protein
MNKSREEMSIVALRVNASFIRGKEILGWPAGIDFHGFSVGIYQAVVPQSSGRGGREGNVFVDDVPWWVGHQSWYEGTKYSSRGVQLHPKLYNLIDESRRKEAICCNGGSPVGARGNNG